MRIYFEQRELFYIDVETADTYDEALAMAQSLHDDPEIDFWEECAQETGMIEIHWHDEETSAMLQD